MAAVTEPAHIPAPDDGGPYDRCQGCGLPIVQHWDASGVWVAMATGSAACYPAKPKPARAAP